MSEFLTPYLKRQALFLGIYRFFSDPSMTEFNHHLIRLQGLDQAKHFHFPASEFIFQMESCLQFLEAQEEKEGKNIFPMSTFISSILRELRSFQCDPSIQVTIIESFRDWLESFKLQKPFSNFSSNIGAMPIFETRTSQPCQPFTEREQEAGVSSHGSPASECRNLGSTSIPEDAITHQNHNTCTRQMTVQESPLLR